MGLMAVAAIPSAGVQRGVALGQLAAVHAAVLEGFELDEVLDVEGLPKPRWLSADAAWKGLLASDEEACERYGAALAEHRVRLGSAIAPLDDDIVSWMRFLRTYAAHEDAFGWLSSLGLNVNDLARLQSRWQRLMDEHDVFAKRAAEVSRELDEEEPGVPLPEIVRVERALTPSQFAVPLANRPSTKAAREADAVALLNRCATLGLDRFAALITDLGDKDEEARADVLAGYDLTTDRAQPILSAWQARLDSDPQLLADFRSLCAHYEQRVRLGEAAPPQGEAAPAPGEAAPAPGEAAPPREPIDETAIEAPLSWRSATLPFGGWVPGLPLATPELPGVPSQRVPSLDLTISLVGDLLVGDLLGAAFMPFDGPPSTRATPLVGEDWQAGDPPPLSGSSVSIEPACQRAHSQAEQSLDSTGFFAVGLLFPIDDDDELPSD